jgi:hypothetical protein
MAVTIDNEAEHGCGDGRAGEDDIVVRTFSPRDHYSYMVQADGH